jgi:hypothetical protein
VLPLTLVTIACAGASTATSLTDVQSGVGSASGCRPNELHAMFRGFQGNGGSLEGAAVVVKASGQPCWLTGSPRSVTLLDDSGDAIALKQQPQGIPPDAGPVELVPNVALPSFGLPAPRGSAWFTLTWTNWCSDASPSVRSLLIVLPAGGSLVAPVDTDVPIWAIAPATPNCANRKVGSYLAFGRFQAPAV